MVAIRLHYLSPPGAAITSAIYAELVLQMSIMLSSVTCAGSFFRTFDSQQNFGGPESGTAGRAIGYVKRDNNTANNSFQMISKGMDDTSPFQFAGDDDTAPLRSAPSQTFQSECSAPYTTSVYDATLGDHQKNAAAT